MKQYETFEQAKIDNPKDVICKLTYEGFTTESEITKGNFGRHQFTYCQASDYCEMTVEKFLKLGHKFVAGDVILGAGGNAIIVYEGSHVEECNEDCIYDSQRFILRAAALENQINIDKVETQTPEEAKPEPKQGEVWRCILLPHQYVIYLYKANNEWDTDWVNQELLEGQTIKPIQKLYTQSEVESISNSTSTEHQEEMRSFSGDVEWKNGDECQYNDINWLLCGFHPVNGLAIIANNDEPSSHQVITVDVDLLSKPETQQQREERERLESAYDLYCHAIDKETTFDSFCNFGPLKDIYIKIVDKTNYRKGVK